MNPSEYLSIIHTLGKLKEVTRHAWAKSGRQESVAEHSWRLAMMAYFTREMIPEADGDKLIKLALIHDLGEIFTGDIPAFEKTDDDEAREERELMSWLVTLPESFRRNLTALMAEYQAQTTLEAKIVKALDRMEAVITHNESDLKTWLPLEYNLQYTYGVQDAAVHSALQKIRALVNDEVTAAINAAKNI